MAKYIKKSPIEKCRSNWARVAKKYGWYKEPFFVQVWMRPDGSIEDSVSFKELDRDIILKLKD